jgi:hypothetical protein
MKEGYTVIELLPDQTGPREVGVSFELDGHGWKILEQSTQWKNLLKLLEDLQRESKAAAHQDREQSEERIIPGSERNEDPVLSVLRNAGA